MKKKILLLGLPIVPIAFNIVSMKNINENENVFSRQIQEYDSIFKKLYDKLGFTNEELQIASKSKVKIGIIDGGFVDSNILKFGGNTLKEIDLSSNYSLLENKSRRNSNFVHYFKEDAYYPELYNKNFQESWNVNKHATQIASLLVGDSGLFKKGEIFSAKMPRLNSDFEKRIEEILIYFKENGVKHINISYSFSMSSVLISAIENIHNLITSSPEDSLEWKLKLVHANESVITVFENQKFYSKLYYSGSSLLDEYAEKYKMKFFISSGNYFKLYEKFEKWLEEFKKYIYKKNSNEIVNRSLEEIIAYLERREKEVKDYQKKIASSNNYFTSSKNTFIVGASNFDSGKLEDFSDGGNEYFPNSPLILAPDSFSEKNILLNTNWRDSVSKIDDDNENMFTGTSFSTPIVLAMVLLLETKENKEFDIPQLKLAVAGSGNSNNVLDKSNFAHGIINWSKLKRLIYSVKKINIKDFKNGVYESNNILNYSNKRIRFLFGTFSKLHKLHKELRTITEEEILKYINPFFLTFKYKSKEKTSVIYNLIHRSDFEGGFYFPNYTSSNLSEEGPYSNFILPVEKKFFIYTNNKASEKSEVEDAYVLFFEEDPIS
ncbi:S8/S53 family peptidase [Mycoplasma procyoni]|uniref:S8/S53 family peptidase n=1 Tax=Mycoplasma procyoni TaxID=568784 RepID=UPI00197BE36A|nr:S8/S53 family peptidase [Mycoplasma procyoni]MBN3535068.1 S8/S53 family peptidase [Mycoplasma procyoni]